MDKKDIGLNAKKPAASCNDRNCPWHGTLKVRGRIFRGRVRSARRTNTAIVEWDYYHYIPKYERYERRRTKISVHSPQCINAKAGDLVRIGECRPLTKTKKFVIIEKVS